MDTQERKLRILVIAPTPFFADRGCHVRILEQAHALITRGHKVTICTYHHGNDVEGVEIRRSLRIPWYTKLSAGPSLHKFYVDLLLLVSVVRSGLKSRPDIIHAHLHEGVLIGKLASIFFRVPVVADLQGSLSGELAQHHFVKENGLIYNLFRWLEQILVKLPEVVLVSSTKLLPGLIDGEKDKTSKVVVIRDGVDTECFTPIKDVQQVRENLGVPTRRSVIGYLGVLTHYQGISVLLTAIPHVLNVKQDIHFLIMGYPNVEDYQRQAKELGVDGHVTFTGRVDYNDAPTYLGACDVAVSPKLLSSEANGKLLNYMALGIPVIASDTPVNRDILGENGIFFQVGDPFELAKAITTTLSNPDHAENLGRGLRNRAIKEYSWKVIGDQIVETYGMLLGAQPALKLNI